MIKVTLRQLQIFTAVYQTGATSRAAEQVALSQSAVSMALAELETQLGVQLFDRAGKRLQANAAAEQLYPKAEEVLKRVQDIEAGFTRQQIQLNVGASSTIGNYWLPKIIKDFREHAPHVSIRLQVQNTAEVCAGVKQLAFDIGFIEGYNPHRELELEPWRTDKLQWFAANPSQYLSSNKLNLEQLKELPLVLREEGSGTRQIMQDYLGKDLQPYDIIELGHSEAIKQAVINDLGVSCLSESVLADALNYGRIQTLTIANLPEQTRTLYLVKHPNKYIGAGLQLFLDFCRNYSG